MNYNLALPFYKSSVRNANALALSVGGAQFSYGALRDCARRIAGWLENGSTESGNVAILASRTMEAYAGILGVLWSGKAYLPISPRTPEDRLIRILQMSKPDALIVDAAGLELLSERVLECAPKRVLHAPGSIVPRNITNISGIEFRQFADLRDEGPAQPVSVAGDELAYIIFTSGTTGTPKGVMIETESVACYCGVVQERCKFGSNDRVSQAADLTFDNSVLDLFVTWAAGSALYVVPTSQLMAPAKFIQENELTIWFSVPSTACILERLKLLTPGAFPSLRCSIFAGEPLPIDAAKAWQIATPNGVVENFYGPTEVTVDCLAQRLEDPPKVTPSRGCVAIGRPFPGIQAGIVDANLTFRPPGEQGELVVSGRQLARGYLSDPELTAARFPVLDGKRWYRTGDFAYQDDSGTFHHLGRIDNQVKILGNRVELEEVEAHLRRVVGTDLVAAVAWPLSGVRATGIVAFHTAHGISRDKVRDGMRHLVPDYMIPQRVHQLAALPLSSNGKVDRNALIRMLDENVL